MTAIYCPACYARRVYCRKCKTYHCWCSWAVCPHKEMCACGHVLAEHYTMKCPPGIDAWFCKRCKCDSWRKEKP